MSKQNFLPEHALKLWHPTRNLPIKPENVTSGSSKKVWWLCGENHEWETTISSLCYFNSGCPYCNKGKVLQGFNDLATLNPELLKFWDYNKNGTLTPENVTSGSGKKVWWVCEKKHSTLTAVYKKTKGTKCGVCSNKILQPGVNDLLTLHPDLAKQYSSKNSKPANLISPGSHAKTIWECPKCFNEWVTTPKHRTRSKSNCPFCVNQKIAPGFNDIATTHPQIIPELHPSLNSLDIEKIISHGHKQKLWWVCPEGHTYESLISDKIRNKCGVCANQVISPGVNDLASCNPNIASEWHPTKNSNLLPSQVTAGSNRKIWWECKNCKYEWETTVQSRKTSGCPSCYHKNSVSQVEKTLQNYIKQLIPTTSILLNSRQIISPCELDIYVPSRKIAIEFNGVYWHSEKYKPKTYHYDKWLACKKKNIQLIQIWEDDWNGNLELLKRMLAHKMGVVTENKIFARKTVKDTITIKEAKLFLQQNHIQGFASGTYYLALKTETNIVAVLVLKKETNNVLNIVRYATSVPVVGGFSKLLSIAIKTYNPSAFVTFSDNCVSDGGLYKNNGFIAEKELPPDYMYVVKGERKHKFGYRLKRFRNDSTLKFVEGLTEQKLAELNNLPRIWDAGKTKWVKIINN